MCCSPLLCAVVMGCGCGCGSGSGEGRGGGGGRRRKGDEERYIGTEETERPQTPSDENSYKDKEKKQNQKLLILGKEVL